ncbi:4-coumarate--CoA ligase-like 9 [Rhododendron vialii]|uniref:4-coumarate--CoA ligase-like 9 n=1 Tax=Rhododendron vialii TaxID=182163 RepID=UPI0026605973|nr:4-coumarate--CoA ligase-like 9 [Rhododendron vialii]
MANQNSNHSLPSSVDPHSGFCSQTKTYHSIRPHPPLPPQSLSLSVTDFTFSLLRQNNPSPPTPTPPALIDAATGRSIPYHELITLTKTLATSLHRRLGLARGDSAFVLSANSARVPVLYLALFSLGVVVSPSNPSSTPSEVSRQIELCEPVVAFVTGDVNEEIVSLFRRTIRLDSSEFESMMTARCEEFVRIEVGQNDTAAILYSSGTTGKFKGVELTHRNFISSLAGGQAVRTVRPSPAVILCAVPYFHVYGFLYSVRSVMMGESLVSIGKFDLVQMIKAIEGFRVTHVAVAPPVIVSMVNVCDWTNGHDLSSLEVVVSAGAPLTKALIERFKKRFPRVLLPQAYGLTESTAGISRMVDPIESQKIGASGRLVPYCQAKIVDVETGMSLPPFKQGELWLRGPSVMKGYVGDPEATSAILDSEGWLRTGDLCYFDSEGFLYVVDRLKELIKYKGYPVAPVELENLLQTHPDIVDVAVVPYPDEEAGQVPMAFIVKRPESIIDESHIKDFVARQVAPYKKIRRVSFIGSLPKNAPGKVLRKELIKLALSGVSSKL